MQDPLTLPTSNAPLSLISTIRVPNEPPSMEVPYRLAIIGEAPGADEESQGRPFVGASGRFLDAVLSGVGIMRAGCFVGNVCKYRPPGNKIEEFGYEHPKVQEGWEELKRELQDFAPHCILALGNTPLFFLVGRNGITSWRGSIMASPYGKVVPAVHPAAILREYKQWFLFRLDALRARQEAESPTLTLPQRNLELDLSTDEICNRLDNWPAGQLLSFDIEGGLDAFPCCSVAGLPNAGFIIAWSRYGDTDQGRIAQSLSRVLYRTDVPKCLQNSLYDCFVLAYGYNILIRNVHEDTMLKQWELYPELSKGLGTIASIWTREPYYKFERKADSQDDFYRYCIKDSCVTLEASRAQDLALSPDSLRHYRFNMDLLRPFLYMELRGIRYNKTLASTELAQVKAALSECSSRLEVRAGYSITGAKGSVSATKLKKLLYQEKGYPEQKKGRGPTAKVTTDVVALLKLSKKFPNDALLADILLHRKLESISETLEISTDSDGRVRCGYNVVGTETGRITCYTSPTGSGANLQTITKKLRKLYVADEDHWMFQCDLAGADGWTVAAHCLRHGDSTMWDDYHFGLKPARIIALMYENPEAAQYDRPTLKEACKQVDDDGWLYFTCKRIQHASNYGVKETTGTEQIMEDSYKITGSPIYVSKQDFLILQRFYFLRYPGLYQWHEWAKREVEAGRNITSASGHTRTFLGRRKSWNYRSRSLEADHETWKEFLAHEPQANTTYVTNLACLKLWSDPENIRDVPIHHTLLPSGSSVLNHHFIEPLHQVHDALIGQFPKDMVEWAVPKLRSYFASPIRIANVELSIPFDGKYGPSWGELGEKYGGGNI